jgi:hypothetical protein
VLRSLLFLVLIATAAVAKEPPRVAVFDFSLINTSGAADTPEELDRLARLNTQLQTGLERERPICRLERGAGPRSARVCPIHSRL